MLERLFFKRVELWLMLLILLIVAIGGALFGAVVYSTARGSDRFGTLGTVAVSIAQMPKQAITAADQLIYGSKRALQPTAQRFEGRAGFTYAYQPGTRPDLGYLLLSRYDGNLERSVAELVDMNTQKTLHRWLPDYAEIDSRTHVVSALDNNADDPPDRVRMIHPLVLADGSLVFANFYSPLVKVDACSRTLWTIDRLFHHSLERSADDAIWVPIHIEPPTINHADDTFSEDGVAKVSSGGEIEYEKSIPQILIENNLEYYIYGLAEYTDDPTHVNDIQEATFDSRYWRRGDLFISARNISVIFLYRPSENRIIWHRQWDWVNQHDVDILDGQRIAIFDNHKYNYNHFEGVGGHNKVKIYDFSTDKVTSPWETAMAEQDLHTASEGRSEILNDNEVFIEETSFGRAVLLDKSGEATWEYINRAGDGMLYRLNWSRIIDRKTGDKLVETLRAHPCE